MSQLKLSNCLKDNLNIIATNSPLNSNFIVREIILKGNVKCSIIYINGLISQSYLEESIIYPLLFNIYEDLTISNNLCSYISQKYISCYEISLTDDVATISFALKHGKSIVLLENNNNCIVCNTSGGSYRSVSESSIEPKIRGGKESFVESLEINLSIIQQKLKNNNLKIENLILGEQSETDVCLIFIENIIDKTTLSIIKNQLYSIKTSYIADTGYILQYMKMNNMTLFPQGKTTECPDTVISNLLKGKAIIMVSGSPQVLIVPVVFMEFFQAFEDYSNNLILANFDRLIRIIGALIVITISPIYLILLKYNAALIPLNLIKTIINSRMGIPLQPFLEVFSMELLIEFLREGGLRLPRPIGQTLGIVGGIVLGDAATKAGLVSPTTLVVLAIGVISTFTIPNYEMSLTIRFIKFPMLILANLFGFLGLISGLYLLLVSLISLDSFGIPYFSPFAPLRTSGLKDSIIRFPLQKLKVVINIFKTHKKIRRN